jgi:hypothetical protein
MNKKIFILPLFLAAILFVTGCGNNKVQNNNLTQEAKQEPSKEIATPGNSSGSVSTPCKEEKVTLENYGDPGKRLKSCFVEFPGEPSRQDKGYYIVEDICGQFTQEFMENMLGIKLDKIIPPQISSLNNCSYYFDENEYVMLNLEYLKIENQKTGNEFAGYKVEKDPKIPMDNLVVWQEDGLINAIFLVLNQEKFISLRPSSKKTFESENFIELAAKIAGEIKNYK